MENLPMKLLYPFIALAALGLALSIIVHISALLGLPPPLGEASWFLHGGIFVVWFPAVLVMLPLMGEYNRKDLWKAALRGCPRWMKGMTYFFFGYAAINFFIFFLQTGINNQKGENPALVYRGFSGHWMAFYSVALAVLYSAVKVKSLAVSRRCPNGHPLPTDAKFCEKCGMPATDTGDMGGPS